MYFFNFLGFYFLFCPHPAVRPLPSAVRRPPSASAVRIHTLQSPAGEAARVITLIDARGYFLLWISVVTQLNSYQKIA